MKSLVIKAPAKINLSLDVINRRPDGYHDVKMVMQTISLHDRLILDTIDDPAIIITCNCRWVPTDATNVAYKAAALFRDEFNIKAGVKINIDKRIPVAAGLAGGSTDAAAVLKGMRTIFCPGIPDSELMSIGKRVGADVPYCIKGGTMLATGIGEILMPLPALPPVYVVLVKPRVGVSTAWVYKNLKLDSLTEHPDTTLIIEAIENKNISALAANMKNVLETVTIQKHSVIKKIKDTLIRLGAVGSMMSGSGPTVFGIFTEHSVAEQAYSAVKESRWECYMTETVGEEL